MCGIAGILCPPAPGHPLRATLREELERLAGSLHHRGPDAAGVAAVDGAGVAHARLAIIDLSPTGAQPMWSPDRRFVFAYNGEVYNFLKLRDELTQAGERFAGSSDTEVVLRLLAQGGERSLARLDGMFALALLDTQTGELLLARDRIGQKPLYWAPLAGGGFAFASEITALLHLPGVDTSLDPQGIGHLLTFGFVPNPWSLRAGIRQLRPGTALRLRAGAAPLETRWLLSECVREHLVSDVPIGVLLSGGVDSSTVAALAARHVGRLKTYAVVHRDPAYDERLAARAVAERIGSEHHEIEFSDTPLSEDELDLLVDHHGDPFADSSSLAVLRLSREMRREVTVALSGDGGDEVFAGYPRFAHLRMLEALGRVPSFALRGGATAFAAIGARRGRQVARALHVAAMPRARRMVAFTTLFWPEETARLLRPELVPAGAGLDALLAERGASLEADAVASAHWLEQRLILPDDMLTKVDRMSMACSLEVRPPLLAAPVLDFAARLPFAMKNEGTTGKRMLRTLAKRLVPPWVIDRPKKGFALPLEAHGGKVLDEAVRFALDSAASPLRAVFRPE
ncbi:MAG: asparagine synthase (glutamine-hydrolyzing), partial [Proteobacteria bacterium]|nr:asparagine synthase (glutamine-hydrolyzing) [Pseudomonadota bacterium]